MEGPKVSQRHTCLPHEARAQCPGGWHAVAALTGDLLCGELEEPALEEKYVEFAES